MLKQPDPTLHKTTRTEITSLFGAAKLVLDETPKAISPFGGLASFIFFLGRIGFARQVQQHLPFAQPTSNNAIPLAHALTAFLISVVVGAQRFAHCEWLRADHLLHAMLGLPRFPSDDTIRNFFLRFSQARIEAFWRPLWRWLLRLVKCPAVGLALGPGFDGVLPRRPAGRSAQGIQSAAPGAQQSSSTAGGAGRGAIHSPRLAAQW